MHETEFYKMNLIFCYFCSENIVRKKNQRTCLVKIFYTLKMKIDNIRITWLKNILLLVNNKCSRIDFKFDRGAEINTLPSYILNSNKVNVKSAYV